MVRNLAQLYKNAFANLQRSTWILSAAMLINRSGSMVLLFTSLYLTSDLGFSIVDAGFIMSFYGAGSVLGSFTGGWLTDKFNSYSIMLFSLISCGIVLLFIIPATTMWTIIPIIFMHGFCADMFRPANSVAIAMCSTPENRTRSVSLVRLAVNLGFSIGPAAGGLIAMNLGYIWLFVIDSTSSFLAAIMLAAYLPKDMRKPTQTADVKENVQSISAYRNLNFMTFILLVSLYGTCFFQLFASVPQYFSTVAKYSEDTIGLLLALNGMLVVLIEMPLIFFLEKNKRIFRFVIAGTLCLPAAFTILLFGRELLALAIVYTFVITMSEILAMPFMMNYMLSKAPSDRQGQYSALYSIAFGFSIIAAPALGLGIAGKYSFSTMFQFFIVLSLVTAVGFLLLRKK